MNELPQLPQGIGGPELQPLILQINDRLRRIASQLGAGQQGEKGDRGPAGSSAQLVAPGNDTEVIFNSKGKFAADPLFVFLKESSDLILKGPPGSGVIAPVFNTTAVGSELAITQKDSTFHITGDGNGYFQNLAVTSAFNSLADTSVSGSVNTSGTAVTWVSGTKFSAGMVGGYFTISNVVYVVASFTDDQHLTLAGTAGIQTGVPYQFGNAFQTSGGSFVVTGSGHGLFQTVTAATTLNSRATGTTAAVQQASGTFVIRGNGAAEFQTAAVGIHASPVTGVAGDALLSATTSGLYLSLNGGAPFLISNVVAPGAPFNSVQFNNAGAFAGSPNLIWNDGIKVLTITPGSVNSGYQAPVFSSSATGTDTAFTTSGGNFHIYGSGDATFQNLTVTSVFNSLADVYIAGTVNTSGTAVTWVSGSTFSAGMVGGYFTIANVVYVVASFTDNHHLTLTGTAGTQTGVAYQYGNAVQTSGGTFVITGSGHARFQTVTATSTFNSLATGTTAAVQQSSGTFIIFGNGNAQFQQVAVALKASPVTGVAGGTGVGNALISATTAGLYVSINGATPVLLGQTLPGGANTQVQFNSGGTSFAGSPSLTWNGATLTTSFLQANNNIVASGSVSSTGTLFALADLSITGLTSSSGAATFNGYVNTNTYFTYSGNTGKSGSFSVGGLTYTIQGGIITNIL